ncbi:MAG: hypothetical protein MH219_09005 [Marinobacter sp.]|nr:hypothetical protein [Marinobacter sp.]
MQQIANTPGQGRGFATAGDRGNYRMFKAGADNVPLLISQKLGQGDLCRWIRQGRCGSVGLMLVIGNGWLLWHGAIVIGNWSRAQACSIMASSFFIFSSSRAPFMTSTPDSPSTRALQLLRAELRHAGERRLVLFEGSRSAA